MILIKDVHSFQKGRQLYGKSGDRIKVISDRGNVLIIEGPVWAEEKGKPIKTEKKHRYSVAAIDIKID